MASRGKGSQQKGANYERKIATILKTAFGVDVKRTGAQERWKSWGGDVNPAHYQKTILSDFFWECKNRESWAILDWFKKAKDDCSSPHQTPLVVASKNNEGDYVFMQLKDFLRILNELEGYRKESD